MPLFNKAWPNKVVNYVPYSKPWPNYLQWKQLQFMNGSPMSIHPSLTLRFTVDNPMSLASFQRSTDIYQYGLRDENEIRA